MKYGEMTWGQMEAVVNKLCGMEGALQFLRGETVVIAQSKETTSIFPIQVNYDLRLEAAIKAGNYDWKNDDITEKHFPSKRSGQAEIEIQLFHFNKVMTSEEVIQEMDKQGYRPAELPELLAFGAKYPDEQRKYPIVALGSVYQYWDGDRYVSYLWRGDGERDLGLIWFGVGWGASFRFAGVRK